MEDVLRRTVSLPAARAISSSSFESASSPVHHSSSSPVSALVFASSPGSARDGSSLSPGVDCDAAVFVGADVVVGGAPRRRVVLLTGASLPSAALRSSQRLALRSPLSLSARVPRRPAGGVPVSAVGRLCARRRWSSLAFSARCSAVVSCLDASALGSFLAWRLCLDQRICSASRWCVGIGII